MLFGATKHFLYIELSRINETVVDWKHCFITSGESSFPHWLNALWGWNPPHLLFNSSFRELRIEIEGRIALIFPAPGELAQSAEHQAREQQQLDLLLASVAQDIRTRITQEKEHHD